MGINSPSWEEQTRRLLSEAQSEAGALEEEIAELRAKREALAREISAYEIVLQSYFRRIGKQENVEFDWDKFLSKTGTHKDRVRLIAEHNQGIVRVSGATDILYTRGFIKSKKRSNAYRVVQMMLSDMAEQGIFEKIAPGEYRLMPAQKPTTE